MRIPGIIASEIISTIDHLDNESLISAWDFDTNTGSPNFYVSDVSGNNRYGSPQPVTVSGYDGNALSTNDQVVTFNNMPSGDAPSFTITMWAKFNPSGPSHNTRYTLLQWGGTSNKNGSIGYTTSASDGTVKHMHFYATSPVQQVIDSSIDCSSNDWMFLAFVFYPGYIKFYHGDNGSQILSRSNTMDINDFKNGQTPLVYLDNVRVFDKDLSDFELSVLSSEQTMS